ncbi:Maintenance of mitochondrial morphology protein 1 [Neolecta irregularis DAH-3]|uniref:Maintenance of mitochondrial morphology protein 1 n=1 Tax=Neolecta irregularis (strain DAH-3) TaxID=1198029 RepID=A0A1U7LI51_NEOID|nr:Maintenance of mitochondrial morphology protein 1 [Neolecta irregularis DAH-3]|eukprot:OLL22273.1 Maintenance of mitochondrial morphology protein 1 [Neolecta irregularis DAH-3]
MSDSQVTLTKTIVSTQPPSSGDLSVLEYIARITVAQTPRWTFTQGLLAGQLTVILMVCLFLKFFIFGNPTPDHLTRSLSPTQLRKKKSSILRNPPALNISSLLHKVDYNISTHSAESLDWLNVLIAQAVSQFREDARSKDAILATLDEILNGPMKSGYVGQMRVTEVNLGEEFPTMRNCRICGCEGDSERLKQRAQMDIELSDQITLGIETKLLLNYPRLEFAVLPVALEISILKFRGTLSISFISSTETISSSNESTFIFNFAKDFQLELSVRSLVGARSRFQDIPKLTQLVENQLRSWFLLRCVEPYFQQIILPSFWPTKAKEGHATQRHDLDEIKVESSDEDRQESDFAEI